MKQSKNQKETYHPPEQAREQHFEEYISYFVEGASDDFEERWKRHSKQKRVRNLKLNDVDIFHFKLETFINVASLLVVNASCNEDGVLQDRFLDDGETAINFFRDCLDSIAKGLNDDVDLHVLGENEEALDEA